MNVEGQSHVWCRFRSLQRQFALTWCVLVTTVVLIGVVYVLHNAFAGTALASYIFIVGYGSIVVIAVGAAIWNAVAWLQLWAWCCPRCHKRFVQGAFTNWPFVSRCRNCSLPVGATDIGDK
jgi:hypothetical protein